MKFKSIFDDPESAKRRSAGAAGDFRGSAGYLFTPQMELAISAAVATQRPLLITGPAGCGKSSLAKAAATRLGWRYLERTVNSRTEITSLLWEVDHLRRLQDAHAGTLNPNLLAYVRPSVMWTALDPRTAEVPLRLLEQQNEPTNDERIDPAVVLIDEIDKADPDLPNNLLEVLGGLRFEVADTGLRVYDRSGIPLIVITSNDERDLPPAFVRRCICLTLKQPDLLQVGLLHFPNEGTIIDAALRLMGESQWLTQSSAQSGPSAAEFLDFIQACKTLQVDSNSADWMVLAEACVMKGRSGGTAPVR